MLKKALVMLIMVVVTILLFVGFFGCAHAEEESNNNGHHCCCQHNCSKNLIEVIDVEKGTKEYIANDNCSKDLIVIDVEKETKEYIANGGKTFSQQVEEMEAYKEIKKLEESRSLRRYFRHFFE